MDRRELSWLFMATGGGGAGFDGFDDVQFAEVCRELGADVRAGITPYDLLSTYNTLAGENVDSDYHILVNRGAITPPPPMPPSSPSSPMSERVCAALSEAEARDKCEAATATQAPNLADVDGMEAVEEELGVFTRHFCAHEIEKQFYGSSSDTSQWIGLDGLMHGSGGDRSFARLGGFIEAARRPTVCVCAMVVWGEKTTRFVVYMYIDVHSLRLGVGTGRVRTRNDTILPTPPRTYLPSS